LDHAVLADIEVPLTGGNINPGVVRIGNTVRRAMTDASPAVHKLLLHLEDSGFSGCPRFLGIDEKNREVLTYIDGDTGIGPHLWTSDAALVAAARMLRDLHDATVTLLSAEPANWAFAYPDSRRHEVICHNDFAPYNFVFRDEIPIAVFDFDLAGPGPRLRDVAYAAYWMTPLSFHSLDMTPYAEADLHAGCRRLKRFCDCYGVPADAALLDMVAEVLAHMGDAQVMKALLGDGTADKLGLEGHLEHWQCEKEMFDRCKSDLIAALV
jgi:hypothetical protein